tara:strand:+ start:17 stop:556 length:540 start_codon:yes stop_codon:yes gene_type:complete
MPPPVPRKELITAAGTVLRRLQRSLGERKQIDRPSLEVLIEAQRRQSPEWWRDNRQELEDTVRFDPYDLPEDVKGPLSMMSRGRFDIDAYYDDRGKFFDNASQYFDFLTESLRKTGDKKYAKELERLRSEDFMPTSDFDYDRGTPERRSQLNFWKRISRHPNSDPNYLTHKIDRWPEYD